MPTLDDVRAQKSRYLPPAGALQRGPFGGMLLTDVARQASYDVTDPEETFEHNGDETYDDWFDRLRAVDGGA